jgi:hypothetical protein
MVYHSPKCILTHHGYLAILPNKTTEGVKMKNMVKHQHEARAKIIKAMAHLSRLFIIEKLNKKERCVNELESTVYQE